MDWIKVKIRHIDYDFFGQPAEIGWAWIQLMSMTAALERIPSEEQMKQRVGVRPYVSLTEVLHSSDTTIMDVLTKVMEDVNVVLKKRLHDREYIHGYRRKGCKTLRKTLRKTDVNGKIREDKRREDNKNVGANAPPQIDFINDLKSNLAYQHINLDIELAKMDAWLLAHKGRQKTKQFVVNWLNKIEKPLEINGGFRKP